ncbi:MAG TPA: hydroxysqualene dehydroxylase HpnE [Streptosporangiaceae bacterium]|nr:hydroxysqualene dehydroxylase HpnE [Streptosporangiaceae bacterium]
MSAPGKIVVVGGGLAGITAAIALREVGADVTLIEARPRLGGATTSFSRGGLMIDNGQHVFLRCCVAYQGLLARLGMTGAVTMQDRFDVTVLAPGRRARLRRTALPGPLHMGRALLGYQFLSPAQRLRVGRAALALAALDPASPDLDRQRLGDWLAAHGQDEQTRRLLWDLFTVSALNVAGDDANLALAATVVKIGLLGARDAADIGVPAVPLGALHGRAGGALLARLGAQVRLGTKAAAVEVAPGGPGARLRVRLATRRGGGPADGAGETAGAGEAGPVLEADGVVLAVPPAAAARLAPAGTMGELAALGNGTGPGPAQWRELAASPIVNVHVIYDRRVTRLPFAAAVDSPVQWVFDRTSHSGLGSGQYLAVSLSAADGYVDMPTPALREQFLPAMADLFPAAREARVSDFFVTRERRATLRQVPGCERLRPPAATALPGLVLAGAWTDTGWPDTMEGAVRSGLNAVRALRQGLAAPGGISRPGTPAGWDRDLAAGTGATA